MDLLDAKSFALKYLTEMPIKHRLAGMAKDLDAGERVILAYVQASLVLLKRNGWAREDFEEKLVSVAGEPRENPLIDT